MVSLNITLLFYLTVSVYARPVADPLFGWGSSSSSSKGSSSSPSSSSSSSSSGSSWFSSIFSKPSRPASSSVKAESPANLKPTTQSASSNQPAQPAKEKTNTQNAVISPTSGNSNPMTNAALAGVAGGAIGYILGNYAGEHHGSHDNPQPISHPHKDEKPEKTPEQLQKEAEDKKKKMHKDKVIALSVLCPIFGILLLSCICGCCVGAAEESSRQKAQRKQFNGTTSPERKSLAQPSTNSILKPPQARTREKCQSPGESVVTSEYGQNQTLPAYNEIVKFSPGS